MACAVSGLGFHLEVADGTAHEREVVHQKGRAEGQVQDHAGTFEGVVGCERIAVDLGLGKRGGVVAAVQLAHEAVNGTVDFGGAVEDVLKGGDKVKTGVQQCAGDDADKQGGVDLLGDERQADGDDGGKQSPNGSANHALAAAGLADQCAEESVAVGTVYRALSAAG